MLAMAPVTHDNTYRSSPQTVSIKPYRRFGVELIAIHGLDSNVKIFNSMNAALDYAQDKLMNGIYQSALVFEVNPIKRIHREIALKHTPCGDD